MIHTLEFIRDALCFIDLFGAVGVILYWQGPTMIWRDHARRMSRLQGKS